MGTQRCSEAILTILTIPAILAILAIPTILTILPLETSSEIVIGWAHGGRLSRTAFWEKSSGTSGQAQPERVTHGTEPGPRYTKTILRG